ncbi:MAG TPA: hypothetical protein EYH55_03290 [Methanothermococcus okinawensis]|uniref:NADH-quinone oxidoreductase subunit D domain-containing protein n=1 Tax=Methanothermococcus okinawensis TaxID=155863 RepID=A0A832ZYJ6_9EURY|nr:hypothetical protein [Methanothermococcus okinawensis]
MYEGEIAIGPIHSSILEPHRLRLFIEDEIIKDAELTIGVTYRGVELLMEGLPPEKATILAEKICGICSHIHLWCAVRVTEMGCGIEVPERASYIRVIVEELERLHSHTLLFGHIFEVLGHETMAMRAFMIREPILQTLYEISGSRIQYSCPIIGGIRPRCNIPDKRIPSLIERIERFEEKMEKLLDRTLRDPLLISRMKDIGVIDRKIAGKYHALGPTARGSGIRCDMRKMGYVPEYDPFEFEEIILDDGDVLSRVLVRMYECFESSKIIKQGLKGLYHLPERFYNPNYEIREFKPIDTYNEAQRGQVYYSYGVNSEGRVIHSKVRTPTVTNLACMEAILRGHHVSDAEVIITSCDPCFTCCDRSLMVIERKKV